MLNFVKIGQMIAEISRSFYMVAGRHIERSWYLSNHL